MKKSPSDSTLSEKHHFVSVDFHHFKAFDRFSLHLRHFNILVGPNNAGKSTILAAFRILATALRKALSRAAEYVRGPSGHTYGYIVDLSGVSVAAENIFFNYDETEPAHVRFKLSNGNALKLWFPEQGACYLIAESDSGTPRSPSSFRKQFNCEIGFVPILGPVDHTEALYQQEAARLALLNYTAARNFRNIWHHFPDKFDEFRRILKETWPGMDIEAPTVDTTHIKPRLHMFCPEERIPREIFWAGFGFQVWCQMLTHLVQSSDKALFLIDEPDIYLHAELQRQLLSLLRNLGPDILIATHSTEIITEAESDDIVLINKRKTSGKRIKHPSEIFEVFSILGSNLNPTLTQLAKTRRVIFVEGKDFQIISRFARRLGAIEVGNRSAFAVVPIEGFNPERAKNLKLGMETTLGGSILAAVILDRDYRSESECDEIVQQSNSFCNTVILHSCKEIENFLLIPAAMDRAANNKAEDRSKRTGEPKPVAPKIAEIIEDFATEKKNYVTSRILAASQKHARGNSSKLDVSTLNEAALSDLDEAWRDIKRRRNMIPGKEALSYINSKLQEAIGISITPTSIIEAMEIDEVSPEMKKLVQTLTNFSRSKSGSTD